ncbi:TPA: hypothetical protein ACPXRL_004198 [Klebsiella pneumoniae]|uniref:hypothetical protein n=1 Tax=Klebsiella pneumoniae TaxID=573 RepID=UPI000ACE1489|nr:hypothetical protein [Klebsiella pneumoniae]HBQ2700393.1 hypothetical protein [Klebsiella pneumoniae]HBR5773839.1 hypothetical protein [Klebsiella pneumoniae]HBW1799408.1 hypothetical protein [Klebsiella pneumoniae]HBW1850109.1 hypothetical protein [Klebsiella pneumoniae]HBW1904858.1 hypothetical protein [Klebsiella pneumoniae]
MKNNGLTLNQLAERNAALVTEVEKLRAERVQLAAENAALKQYALDCVKEDQIHNDMETPATDAYLAGIKADAITASLDACSDYLETDCVMDRLDISYEEAEKRTSGAIEFHDAMVDFANQLREGADK